MKNLVFLIAGILVTVIFFILSCSDGFNIYEQMFFSQGYNDKMYNLNMYPVIAAITILVSWGGAEPKIDIRDWSPDHSKMGKGITLTAEEIEKLKELL